MAKDKSKTNQIPGPAPKKSKPPKQKKQTAKDKKQEAKDSVPKIK